MTLFREPQSKTRTMMYKEILMTIRGTCRDPPGTSSSGQLVKEKAQREKWSFVVFNHSELESFGLLHDSKYKSNARAFSTLCDAKGKFNHQIASRVKRRLPHFFVMSRTFPPFSFTEILSRDKSYRQNDESWHVTDKHLSIHRISEWSLMLRGQFNRSSTKPSSANS